MQICAAVSTFSEQQAVIKNGTSLIHSMFSNTFVFTANNGMSKKFLKLHSNGTYAFEFRFILISAIIWPAD
jgi:hypothetical protein